MVDLWILKVKCDLDLWPHRWPWPWIFMVKFWNSCISEWEGWLTLHKGCGSRSFMTHDHDHLVTKVRYMDLPGSDWKDFSCWRAVDSSSWIMGASNLKLILISSTWDCTTFHSFNVKKEIFKSWQVCGWLAKWLIILEFMDIRWRRVYRHSNVGLVQMHCKGFVPWICVHVFVPSSSTVFIWEWVLSMEYVHVFLPVKAKFLFD